MARFRKKPVVIEAVHVGVVLFSWDRSQTGLPEWIHEAHSGGVLILGQRQITIRTLEGDMVADYDDVIIRGVKGELYPCKPDIFEATYEAVG